MMMMTIDTFNIKKFIAAIDNVYIILNMTALKLGINESKMTMMMMAMQN